MENYNYHARNISVENYGTVKKKLNTMINNWIEIWG